MLAKQVEKIESYKDKDEYLVALHENSKGWITKAEKNPFFEQWHYKYNDLMELDLSNENTFISLNTFYSTFRRIEYLKELKAHYIDLDIYKTNFTKEQILMNLEDNYFNKSIPRPNFVIDSGRGLYLVWLINSVPSKALPLWKAIEEYLYSQLKEFGADRQALDPTRVLRVPGSINTKSNTMVKVIEQNNYIYDLREIQNNYLPELQEPREKKAKKRGRPKKTVFIFRERSLYYARIQDIIKLCELREYDLRGHRELVLFLYRYWLCTFLEDTEKALQDVLELNSQFRYPLRESTVIRATKSAEKAYLSKDKDYKYKHETLINLLDITEHEEPYMTTIISKKEYKRRKNLRDREYQKDKYQERLKVDGKVSEKDKIEQRRVKIKDLLQQGLNKKDICIQVNISKRTYDYDVKHLKEQGLI